MVSLPSSMSNKSCRLLICLMKKIFIWYLIFLFFKINTFAYQARQYHHLDGLLIYLMKMIFFCYLDFLFFKINSFVLNICRYFHLERKNFRLVLKRKKDRNARLVSIFIWGAFILSNWLIFFFLPTSSSNFCWYQHFQRFHLILIGSWEFVLWTDQFLI